MITAVLDHYIIHMQLEILHEPPGKSVVSSRKLKNISLEQFRLDLCEHLNNAQMSELNDAGELAGIYNNILTRAIDDHAPITTRSVTTRPPSPWFNEDIRHMKQEKRACREGNADLQASWFSRFCCEQANI